MAKEVARYNTVAQNPQSQHSQPNNSVLVWSKSEILRVIELLVEKMPNDVADQIVEVGKYSKFRNFCKGFIIAKRGEVNSYA